MLKDFLTKNSTLSPTRRLAVCYALALLVTAADQLHKWYMLDVINITETAPIRVFPFFNYVMVWNPGISFGMFRDNSHTAYIFSGLAALIILVLSVWLYRTSSRLMIIAIGVVIGGAIGNVIDRLRFGAVADFFDFHVMGYHWPAFNIADAMVFTGALLLCIESVVSNPCSATKDAKNETT
jgi:signal peptidase II